jgi:hypothetical protein
MAGGNRPRLLTLGVAGVGVLVGHWLSYLVDLPDAAARSAALQATGHGYLGIAGEFTSAVLALSIVGVFLGALVDRAGVPRVSRSLAPRLVLLQVGAFVGMELAERVLAGSPIGDLVRGGILPVGALANAALALLGAAILRRILRLAERVADAAPGRAPALALRGTGAIVWSGPSHPYPHAPALAAAPSRGPPPLDCR